MSVRAYRIKRIDYCQSESFNLWHHSKLTEFLQDEYSIFDNLNEGSGIFEIPTSILKKAVKQAKRLELENWVVKQLEKDIEWGDIKNSGYVSYYCF